jgi:hypothetical protein
MLTFKFLGGFTPTLKKNFTNMNFFFQAFFLGKNFISILCKLHSFYEKKNFVCCLRENVAKNIFLVYLLSYINIKKDMVFW